MKYPTLTILLFSLVAIAGCGPLERLKNDVTQSVENVKKEAADVQKKFQDTKEKVEKTVEKVENLVNAVKKFGEDEKTDKEAKRE